MTQVIAKIVEQVYCSPDAKHHVFMMVEAGKPPIKAVFYGDKPPVCGSEYIFSGRWFDHTKFKKQFKINRYKRILGNIAAHENSMKIIGQMLSGQ